MTAHVGGAVTAQVDGARSAQVDVRTGELTLGHAFMFGSPKRVIFQM